MYVHVYDVWKCVCFVCLHLFNIFIIPIHIIFVIMYNGMSMLYAWTYPPLLLQATSSSTYNTIL